MTIPVPEDAADKLRELARREFRTPRAQAYLLILDGLRRAGLDTDLPTRQQSMLAASEADR